MIQPPMMKEVDDILLSLFDIERIDQLDMKKVNAASADFPFSSLFQFLSLIKSSHSVSDQLGPEMGKLSLYFPENMWVFDQIRNKELSNHSAIKEKDILAEEDHASKQPIPSEAVEPTSVPQDGLPELIPIDPYHTVDYFASQGIKLSQLDQGDPLGVKLKSFTAWLKTMKKLQTQENTQSSPDNPAYTEHSSVSAHELATTEAMAEVYIKQGLRDKAIEVYHKLSLQNPANSHIFADKIAALNENRL